MTKTVVTKLSHASTLGFLLEVLGLAGSTGSGEPGGSVGGLGAFSTSGSGSRGMEGPLETPEKNRSITADAIFFHLKLLRKGLLAINDLHRWNSLLGFININICSITQELQMRLACGIPLHTPSIDSSISYPAEQNETELMYSHTELPSGEYFLSFTPIKDTTDELKLATVNSQVRVHLCSTLQPCGCAPSDPNRGQEEHWCYVSGNEEVTLAYTNSLFHTISNSKL